VWGLAVLWTICLHCRRSSTLLYQLFWLETLVRVITFPCLRSVSPSSLHFLTLRVQSSLTFPLFNSCQQALAFLSTKSLVLLALHSALIVAAGVASHIHYTHTGLRVGISWYLLVFQTQLNPSLLNWKYCNIYSYPARGKVIRWTRSFYSTGRRNEADSLINEPAGGENSPLPPRDNDLRWHFLSRYVKLWPNRWRERTVLLLPDAFSRVKMANKCLCGWGSAPDPARGVYSTPTDPLAGLRGPTSKVAR